MQVPLAQYRVLGLPVEEQAFQRGDRRQRSRGDRGGWLHRRDVSEAVVDDFRRLGWVAFPYSDRIDVARWNELEWLRLARFGQLVQRPRPASPPLNDRRFLHLDLRHLVLVDLEQVLDILLPQLQSDGMLLGHRVDHQRLLGVFIGTETGGGLTLRGWIRLLGLPVVLRRSPNVRVVKSASFR